MENFVLPKVYFIGATALDMTSLTQYLEDTGQTAFLEDINEAKQQGLNDGEILCSFYAKACYASLTIGKNKNISRVRDIEDNIKAILNSSHGSVVEHCNLNFMITNCSRVFTHELVRHRAGTAFSQTSGRYVRSDRLDVVIDPILEPAYDLIEEARKYLENWYEQIQERMKINDVKNFDLKKKITSALRRMLPNGQANEIGFSVNLRALRHTIEMRTNASAEWEIRYVFAQIYNLVKEKYPAMFFDAKEEVKNGIIEVTFENRKV
jgi:thymidylate synthase (FAD)